MEATLKEVPKNRAIVVYCGCCPWSRCPNVGAAWDKLQALGYKNVKVLYIPKNFGENWAELGYPVASCD